MPETRKNKTVDPVDEGVPTSIPDLYEVLMKKLDLIQTKVEVLDKLKETVAVLETENAKLKEEIQDLRKKDNEREQYARNSSVRIYGVKLAEQDRTNPFKVMEQVHNSLLRPILQLAVDAGEIPCVPTPLELLETAHILPANKSSTTIPVIARFKSRPFRSLVFKYKRQYFMKNKDKTTSISEDLTRATYNRMQTMKNLEEVERVWTLNGVIKYILKKKKDKTLSLRSPYDEMETL